MSNDKKCEHCGKFYKDTKEQKVQRAMIPKALQGISKLGTVHIDGLDVLSRESKNWCYECWRERVKFIIEPATAMIPNLMKNL